MSVVYNWERYDIKTSYSERHLIELKSSVPNYKIVLICQQTKREVETTLSNILFDYEN